MRYRATSRLSAVSTLTPYRPSAFRALVILQNNFDNLGSRGRLERFLIESDHRHGGDFDPGQGARRERCASIVTDKQRRPAAKWSPAGRWCKLVGNRSSEAGTVPDIPGRRNLKGAIRYDKTRHQFSVRRYHRHRTRLLALSASQLR